MLTVYGFFFHYTLFHLVWHAYSLWFDLSLHSISLGAACLQSMVFFVITQYFTWCGMLTVYGLICHYTVFYLVWNAYCLWFDLSLHCILLGAACLQFMVCFIITQYINYSFVNVFGVVFLMSTRLSIDTNKPN